MFMYCFFIFFIFNLNTEYTCLDHIFNLCSARESIFRIPVNKNKKMKDKMFLNITCKDACIEYGTSMVGKENITHFDDLDEQKENILPIRAGRSAHRLVRALTMDEAEIKNQRAFYMTRIMTEFEEHDDPLLLYLEYIDWINHTFPQGGLSKQSGMLSAIEDCIIRIKDMERYLNDSRYIKVWLWYMDIFTSKYKSDCRDLYFFMLRNRIGHKLAILYEELSGILLELNQKKYAIAILEMGIKEAATPVDNLTRRKKVLLESESTMDGILPVDSNFIQEAEQLILGSKKTDITRRKGHRNQFPGYNVNISDIFRDTDVIEGDPINFHSWKVFEDLKTRNKENMFLPSPLEVSKATTSTDYSNEKSKKMSIFQDNLGRAAPIYKVLKVAGRKNETIDFNIDLLMCDNPKKERCIEEIIASMYQRKRTKVSGKRLNEFPDDHASKRANVSN